MSVRSPFRVSQRFLAKRRSSPPLELDSGYYLPNDRSITTIEARFGRRRSHSDQTYLVAPARAGWIDRRTEVSRSRGKPNERGPAARSTHVTEPQPPARP